MNSRQLNHDSELSEPLLGFPVNLGVASQQLKGQ